MAECLWIIFLALCCVEVCAAADKDKENDRCSVYQAVRLDAVQENATCSYVEGRVQICDNGRWKNLCDTQWTEEDARVTCKSLNYVGIGAQNITYNQLSSGTSTFGLKCNGSETSTTQCIRAETKSKSDRGLCTQAAFLLCFTDNKGTNCRVPDGSKGDTVQSLLTTSHPSVGETISPTLSSTPQPTTTTSTVITSPLTETGQSKGFFYPPTLYYLVASLAAAITVMLLGVIVITITMCFMLRQQQRKKSLLNKQLATNTKEDQLESNIYESIVDTALPQELKQPQAPVYEFIKV